jgi:hypothetical protein
LDFRAYRALQGLSGCGNLAENAANFSFSFQYVNELSGGNQGGQAHENQSELLKRKIPL